MDKETEVDTDASTKLLEELQSRVDALESSSDLNIEHIELLIEIIKIISEMPVGKRLLNRAVNRKKLEKLENIVLPRRKNDLAEIMRMDMPEGVLNELADKEMHLISKCIRHIMHRRSYEIKSADSLGRIMSKFFKTIGMKLESMQSKSLPNHT